MGEAMRFELFEAKARRFWHDIPLQYREGVEGVVVERRALPHPKLRDIYTLGECLTESYPSSYEGPETLRSVVVLYYGSFVQLARLDREFDWESEIWETLTHELQHHLESLAAEDTLEDRDYATDENYKRLDGHAYDPLFFRAGEEVEPGVYMVDEDLFIEHPERARQLPESLEFSYGRARYRVQVPPAAAGGADVWLIRLTAGVPAPGEAYLVVTRRPGLLESVRGLLSGRRARVREAEAGAERL